MFKTKIVVSIFIFISLLVLTSIIKNETRLIEKKIITLNAKIFSKEKDINESQFDFYYLSSPAEIKKKLDIIGFNYYKPISHSNIYLNISDFTNYQNKISNLNNLNEKKTQKK